MILVMSKRAPKQTAADTQTARRIAEAMRTLNLDAAKPESWVEAIEYANAGRPSAATVQAAVDALKRLSVPPVELVLRRESHSPRRRR
jgi:hypothetical protein